MDIALGFALSEFRYSKELDDFLCLDFQDSATPQWKYYYLFSSDWMSFLLFFSVKLWYICIYQLNAGIITMIFVSVWSCRDLWGT